MNKTEEQVASFSRPDYPIIVWMTLVHVLGVVALFHFSWAGLATFVVMYYVTGCLGITLGYHRLLSHRSFALPKAWERFFTTCGALALQGGPSEWTAHHRLHHAASDTDRDPHNASRGFWFSHLGWMLSLNSAFGEAQIINRFARDLRADSYYRWLDYRPNQILIQIALGVLFLLVGGWSVMLWGIFFRLMIVYHVTWFVNSASHIWGYRTYEHNKDLTRNNWWVALLAFGEGWHNNHHAFPNVARAGHKPWEFDLTFLIIRSLNALGLVSNLKDIKNPTEMSRSLESASSRPAA